jgi:hypothetical protein
MNLQKKKGGFNMEKDIIVKCGSVKRIDGSEIPKKYRDNLYDSNNKIREAEKTKFFDTAPVETVTFHDGYVDANADVHSHTNEITLITTRPPLYPFVKGEKIHYYDSNRHNDRDFIVDSQVGPSKYKLMEY